MKRNKWLSAVLLLVIAAILIWQACVRYTPRDPAEGPSETSTEAPTATPEVTPTATSEPTPTATPEPYIVTVYEATCEQGGYSTYESRADGSITIRDETPPLGHDFGPWTADPDTGENVRTCRRCGAVEERSDAADQLPRLEFTGSMEGISKENRVLLNVRFDHPAEGFEGWAYVSWQGHSTLTQEKKNYTVRFFEDEAMVQKHRMPLFPGQLEHKYVLKANYADPSQCRNLVCAGVWGDMAASREGVPERLRDTANYGAVEGMPVTVWLNGEFLGLYTLNLHKDDDLYAMRGGSHDAVMICNAQTMDEALFRAPAAFEADASDWEVEYCGTGIEDSQWARDSFNELIDYIMNSDDEAFRAGLSERLDVNGAIDYLLFMYAMGLTDSAAKDLVMLKYDDGPWIPSVYDMEDAFGLSADGASAVGPEAFLPEAVDGVWTSNTGSLLWDRLLNGWTDGIRARWRQLRADAFFEDRLAARVTAFLDGIPETLVEGDLALYPNRAPLPDPQGQILEYISLRLKLLDGIFEEG